jgi:YD repeat-containing protein
MVAAMLSFVDCSKKSTSKPASQVSSIKNSNGATWNFSYDDQGRIETILYAYQANSTTRTFQYGNKELFLSTVDQAGTVTIDTLELNADGSVSSEREVVNNQHYHSTDSYSNGDLDTSTYTASYNGVPITSTSTYTYQNGDMVSNSGGVTYTYYQNQPAAALDFNQAGEYENYGNACHDIKCAHMMQTYTTSNGTITFTYDYDSLGRVTEIDYGNAELTSTTITWQ